MNSTLVVQHQHMTRTRGSRRDLYLCSVGKGQRGAGLRQGVRGSGHR